MDSTTAQDTHITSNEKDQYDADPVASAAPELMAQLPENIFSESSLETGTPLPTTALASTPTSLTSIPPHLKSETPIVPSAVHSKSRPASRDASPYPRSRPSTPNRLPTPSSSAASSTRSLPPRRSARTLVKGPERPRGPPELEAALTIAIRNLESDIYEWWCANQKPGNPIPTTAYLKGRSPRIRRAAKAVDEADRRLNEAVYGKSRRGRPLSKKSQGKSDSGAPYGDVPETAFGQLELSSQSNSPLPLTEAQRDSMPHNGGDEQQRPLMRDKESTGN